MKVTTDGCLFGAWCAAELKHVKKGVNKALDVGTGTGLLSLMVAQKNNVLIDAVEIDADSFEQAANNVTSALFFHHISVVQADILVFENSSYDCIISNPPFYENDLQSPSLKKNAAHHNISLTWIDLLKIIDEKLTRDGKFFLLLPYKRWKEAQTLIEQQYLFINQTVFVKQSPRHKPFRIMVQGSRMVSEVAVSEVVICDESNNYTPPFLNLLTDYYLHL